MSKEKDKKNRKIEEKNSERKIWVIKKWENTKKIEKKNDCLTNKRKFNWVSIFHFTLDFFSSPS
jgi:hypothetical protein